MVVSSWYVHHVLTSHGCLPQHRPEMTVRLLHAPIVGRANEQLGMGPPRVGEQVIDVRLAISDGDHLGGR